jgi:hypothetical protein
VAGEVTVSFTTGENLTYARIRQSAREHSLTDRGDLNPDPCGHFDQRSSRQHSPLAELMLGEQAATGRVVD